MAKPKSPLQRLFSWSILAIPYDHFSTLGEYGEKPRLRDFAGHIGVPMLAAVALQWFELKLNSEFLNALATALSIFAALLFSVLLILLEQVGKSVADKEGPTSEMYRRDMLSMLYRNVCYTIFIAVVALILLLVRFVISAQLPVAVQPAHPAPVPAIFPTLFGIADFLLIAALVSFVITLVMILQRTYLLFRRGVDTREGIEIGN